MLETFDCNIEMRNRESCRVLPLGTYPVLYSLDSCCSGLYKVDSANLFYFGTVVLFDFSKIVGTG